MQTEGLLVQSQQLATELQTQQRELQQTNEQLAQKAQQLAEQNAEVERKNREIEEARRAVEEKATELALTSKYKSEFLANMSHELRTPLNSILILAQQLADNVEGNLTAKQGEFARTIHGAGTDLLNLITDILDLSKIESGTVTVMAEEVVLTSLIDGIARPFRHESEGKRLEFEVSIDESLANTIVTDAKRLQQVLKNLLSNALKFTEQGTVSLSVSPARGGWSGTHPVLERAANVLAFEVTDTGIGISPEKQRIIFEAFQQADAGTSRKYGGTGLGLAISRELAFLLGGEIQLRSMPGVGSTFTLFLPDAYVGPSVDGAARVAARARGAHVRGRCAPPRRFRSQCPMIVTRSRTAIRSCSSSRTIPTLPASWSMRRTPRDSRCWPRRAAPTRSSSAKKYRPTAISLDVFLPDMLGWSVLNQLKQDPALRHIPVQIVSLDEDRQNGLARGAFSFLVKPATTQALQAALSRVKEYAAPRNRKLLVIEDNPAEQMSITELLGHDDVEIATAATGREALDALRGAAFDCAVLDLRLPDMSGFEVLEHIRDDESSG